MERLSKSSKGTWEIKIQGYNNILKKWITRMTLEYYDDLKQILSSMNFNGRKHRIIINTNWLRQDEVEEINNWINEKETL